MLGLERGKKKRPAGFRTHMLVCMGAALVMITNAYMARLYPGVDVSRMGAQVISGIGFLGAGSIIVTGQQRIKGLTTAAGLWVVACIGLAFGTGYYAGGIIATALCFIIYTVLHRVEDKMNAGSRVLGVYVELSDISYAGGLLEFAREKQFGIEKMETGKTRPSDEHVGITLLLKTAKRTEHSEIVLEIASIEGVCLAEEIG